MRSVNGERVNGGPETAAGPDAILDVAESLFYTRGISAVTMREVRAAAQVSLKRLYREFGSKEDLVTAYLTRRDGWWLGSLREHLSRAEPTTPARLQALFEWLASWFSSPGFNGCAFVNAHGELGSLPDSCRQVVVKHLAALRTLLAESVLMPPDSLDTAGTLPGSGEAAGPTGGTDSDRSQPIADDLAWDLFVIVEGAITTATVTGHPDAARRAGRLAQQWWQSLSRSGS